MTEDLQPNGMQVGSIHHARKPETYGESEIKRLLTGEKGNGSVSQLIEMYNMPRAGFDSRTISDLQLTLQATQTVLAQRGLMLEVTNNAIQRGGFMPLDRGGINFIFDQLQLAVIHYNNQQRPENVKEISYGEIDNLQYFLRAIVDVLKAHGLLSEVSNEQQALSFERMGELGEADFYRRRHGLPLAA